MSHEKLCRFPPVGTSFCFHGFLKFPLAQYSVAVQVVLRLVLYYARDLLLRLGRVFDEEGTGSMRLLGRQRQTIRYLCQGALQLSRLTGQIGGVSVRITFSQSSQAEGQERCYDVDNIC